MMKLWDVRTIRRQVPEEEKLIEPEHTYRGHTGPLFALASNNAESRDKTFIYSAGSEGIIRIWKVPPSSRRHKPQEDNFNFN